MSTHPSVSSQSFRPSVKMYSLIVLGFVLCLLVLTLYVRYCYFGRQISKIPGPKRLPLVGNAIQVMGLNPESVFEFLRTINKEYGPINKLSSFLIAIINISDPEYVEKLFSTARFNEKRTPYTFLKSWLCEGLLISNGEKWKQRRKLLTPAFHFTILKNFCSTFSDQTEVFLAHLQKETQKDFTDLVPLVSRATLNIMCETSMGISMHKNFELVTNKYFKALHILGHIFEQRVVKVWLHADWIHKLTSTGRTETKLMKDLHEFTDKIIQDRQAHRKDLDNNNKDVKSRKCLAMLDLLLENIKEGKIDMDGVREEVDTFLFEGHDTTAMALIYMIMRIANEPEVQDKIYKELVTLFGDSERLPSIEDLHEMKYLECCIKESLRIYPSVPLIARYVSEDVNLGKYTVPKGAYAFIHVYDIHHNLEMYPDPEQFIPERFLPQHSAGRHPYSYIPFSAGPRNCIGQKFAMLEMKTVMSGLLRRYRLEPVTKPEDIVFVADLVLRSKYPIYVRFRNRESC